MGDAKYIWVFVYASRNVDDIYLAVYHLGNLYALGDVIAFFGAIGAAHAELDGEIFANRCADFLDDK